MAKPTKKSVSHISALSAEEMLKSMRELLGGTAGAPSRTDVVNLAPKADVFMLDDKLVVELEVPGVDPDKIDLSFIKNNLFVSGAKAEKKVSQKGTYICMERGFGKFYRSIELPFPIDTKKIKAIYRNGILRVEAEKISDKRGAPKRIKITSG